MKINEGSLDRLLRIALGVGLIALATIGHSGLWAWIGVVPLATGLKGFCPLYAVLGMNTNRKGGK